MSKAKGFPMKPGKVFRDLVTRPPGVYADIPEHEYHRDEAFSASKARNLIVGPAHFWTTTPWNPDNNGDDDSTAAQIEGKAYHKRILEGPAAFDKSFANPPRKSDYPDAIDGSAALKAACDALGLKKSGTNPELVARLKESGEFKGEFWIDILARWEADNKDKQRLPADAQARVMLAARICEKHPDIGRIWESGRPEVSVFWNSPEGVPMRCRIDWWRPGEITELKTLANQMRNPFALQCTRTIVNEFYHVQACIERQAAEAALQMPDELWHGFTADEIAAYRKAGVPDVRILMIGKSAPDIYQRILAPEVPVEYARWEDGRPIVGDVPREPSEFWRSAENIRAHMVARFADGWMKFGRDPWFEAAPPIGLTDHEPGLSQWALARDTEV